MKVNNELLSKFKALTGEESDELSLTYLDIAGEAITNKCFPFAREEMTVPVRYKHKQLDIAVYLYNKRGAEGETKHNENGIDRSYESAGIPESMLKGITPHGRAFKWVDENETA